MKKLPNISTIFSSVASFVKRYSLIILFLILSSMYGFLAFRINSLTQAEPSDEAVAERLKTVPRTKVDEDAIAKMRQLEEENIEIKALFDEARNNPFQE